LGVGGWWIHGYFLLFLLDGNNTNGFAPGIVGNPAAIR
jgi:hypothetical protein